MATLGCIINECGLGHGHDGYDQAVRPAEPATFSTSVVVPAAERFVSEPRFRTVHETDPNVSVIHLSPSSRASTAWTGSRHGVVQAYKESGHDPFPGRCFPLWNGHEVWMKAAQHSGKRRSCRSSPQAPLPKPPRPPSKRAPMPLLHKEKGLPDMAILITPETKIIVQGISGPDRPVPCTGNASKPAQNVVGGVTPGRGWHLRFLGKPVFNTVREAVEAPGADASF